MGSAKYYEMFDTIVNKYMQEEGDGGMQGLVVHSACDYLAPVGGFPGPVVLGLATAGVGETSVRWRVGVWSVDPRPLLPSPAASGQHPANPCRALGLFVHAFVRPDSPSQSVPLSPKLRNAALRLLVPNS